MEAVPVIRCQLTARQDKRRLCPEACIRAPVSSLIPQCPEGLLLVLHTHSKAMCHRRSRIRNQKLRHRSRCKLLASPGRHLTVSLHVECWARLYLYYLYYLTSFVHSCVAGNTPMDRSPVTITGQPHTLLTLTLGTACSLSNLGNQSTW